MGAGRPGPPPHSAALLDTRESPPAAGWVAEQGGGCPPLQDPSEGTEGLAAALSPGNVEDLYELLETLGR